VELYDPVAHGLAASVSGARNYVMVLSDYGTAGHVSLLYPDRNTRAGTSDWAPPEFDKRRRINYTNRYDSWGLGLLALELNLGSMPFQDVDCEKAEFRVSRQPLCPAYAQGSCSAVGAFSCPATSHVRHPCWLSCSTPRAKRHCCCGLCCCLQAMVEETYHWLPEAAKRLAAACFTPSASDRPNVTSMLLPAPGRRWREQTQPYLRASGCDVLCAACRDDKRKRE